MANQFPIPTMQTFEELASIETDDCVRWPRSHHGGYGYISVGSVEVGTHVLACTRRHGEQPTPAHEVAHSCRNRDCLNYRHLRWSTRRENILDRVRDGTDNRGEKHPMAKLTASDVSSIREQAEWFTRAHLARVYGVSSETIRSVVCRETWAWLE